MIRGLRRSDTTSALATRGVRMTTLWTRSGLHCCLTAGGFGGILPAAEATRKRITMEEKAFLRCVRGDAFLVPLFQLLHRDVLLWATFFHRRAAELTTGAIKLSTGA